MTPVLQKELLPEAWLEQFAERLSAQLWRYRDCEIDADHLLLPIKDALKLAPLPILPSSPEVADVVERLTKERDEAQRRAQLAEEAELEAKDCFWAVYPTYIEATGHGISTEAARTQLAADLAAAQAALQSAEQRAAKAAAVIRDYCDCPRPANDQPDGQTAGQCFALGLCGCVYASVLEAPGAGEPQTAAARDVLSERERQKSAEGWTAEHDDAHVNGELSAAAVCYAFTAARSPHEVFTRIWPWSWDWWKPKDTRRNLVRAAALILADIERLDRSIPQQSAEQKP